MPAPSPAPVSAKSHARSRVSNGKALLPGNIDGRSTWVRRLRDLIAMHIADLGGEGAISEAERPSCGGHTLVTELERLETRFADAGGATADAWTFTPTVRQPAPAVEAMGLQRRAAT